MQLALGCMAADAQTRIHGTPTAGCITGAAQLAPDGPGWEAVRPSRDRHWGHPALLVAVADLAARARDAGLPPLWVGDLAQPRGGPMPYGHASHQTGLDVDIWLAVDARPPLPRHQREAIEVPSVVAPDGGGVDPARWHPGHAALIRLAAETPGVDRVLVNPAIKRALCGSDPGAAWLRRVRPWRGHDSHIHIRLRCPHDQPACRDQPAMPRGDGCDATLDWWFTAEARIPPAPGPATVLPEACRVILNPG